ncbi:MAG: hypothetical protein KGS09_10375 [Nitrospirae bacterium]|nr:hypothetical protein [Nitrospirota bacterium]MDE3043073.1 hypothetical protein [Nitrospirota bacterium]
MATRIADVILKTASLVLYGFWCYLVGHHGWDSLYLVPLILIAGLLVTLRLPPNFRVNAVLVGMALCISAYAGELVLAVEDDLSPVQSRMQWLPFQSGEEYADARALAASPSGISFDRRSRLQVLTDLRAKNVDAWPSIAPQFLFDGWPNSYEDPVIEINGAPALPLGGVSNTTTVYCNENGYYVIYESDEHGFENPKGLWSAPDPLDVAVIGDSYAHGACVKTETNFASLIRQRYPATLNLGGDGNGPLLELATLKEYVPPLRPRVVLWFYFEMNDMGELLKEKKTFLTKYLTPEFTQGLIARQAEIDQALKRHVDRTLENFTVRSKLVFFSEHLRDPLSHSDEFEALIKMSHLRKAAEQVLVRFSQGPKDEVQALAPLPALSRDDLDLFAKTLSQAKSTVSQWGGKLVFVYLPQYERYAKPEFVNKDREQVLRIVRDLDLPLIDLHPRFQAQADPLSLFPFRRRGHYNEKGHRVVAEEVLNFLRDMHLEPSRKNNPT